MGQPDADVEAELHCLELKLIQPDFDGIGRRSRLCSQRIFRSSERRVEFGRERRL